MIRHNRFASFVLCIGVPLLLSTTAPVGLADCVDECTVVPGENLLQFEPAKLCVKPGDIFEVELWQRNLQELCSGHQSFMQFDPDCMRVLSVTPTPEPYGIVGLKRWDNVLGTIDLIAGINKLIGQEPTDKDALLATIEFIALQECCSPDPKIFGPVVCFREYNPPSRLSNPKGYPIEPLCLKFARVKIDGTDPVIDPQAKNKTVECGPLVPLQFDDWLKDHGGARATDNCSEVTWTYEYKKVTGCCETWYADVTFKACDCSGNCDTTKARFTVVDTTPPKIDPPAKDLTVECDGQGNKAEFQAWLDDHGGARATDICCTELTWTYEYTWIALCCETGYADVTFTVCDDCGNCAETTARFTIEDTTPPKIDPAAKDMTVECDPAINEQQFQAWLDDHGGARATDICCTELTWTYRYQKEKLCCETWYANVTFTVCDDCGNCAETTARFTVEDTKAPLIDPAAQSKMVECDPAVNLQQFKDWLEDHGGARATDICCPELKWSYAYTWVNGCCETGYADVTFTVCDDCGNCAETKARFEIKDTKAPLIDPPAKSLTVECDGKGNKDDFQLWLDDHGGARATEICCPEVTWTYEYTWVPLCCETGYADVTFKACDDCGNCAETTATFTIEDTLPPEFDPPCTYEVIKVFPNAGECTAQVTLPDPKAIDICCGVVPVEHHRSDGEPWGSPFHPGETNVWWTATDDCGNGILCLKVIQVEASNLVQVLIEMPGVFQPVSRCIDFKLWKCPGTAPSLEIEDEVVFVPVPPPTPHANGVAQLRVECEGPAFDCMTAQDRLHTLRSTAELKVEVYEHSFGHDRTWYVAEYTMAGKNALIAGNLDACQYPEDWFIDILDFGVLMSQWATHYPLGGNTPCSWPCPWKVGEEKPHADIDGDGVVKSSDVSFWLVNLLKEYMKGCCGTGTGGRVAAPVMRISVEELREKGWSYLAAGDLNNDGWLDQEDVIAFMNGARPKAHAEPTEVPDPDADLPQP